MKKLKILLVFMCLFVTLFGVGCGDKDLSPAKIVRDDERTGGSLSFVYDKNQAIVYIGGDEEIVQFSNADEIKGLSEGCRIGLKVVSPDDELLDLTNSVLEMNGINYSSGNFLESINGQKQPFFNIYPLVSPEIKEVKFSITWQDGTKKQEYKIMMVDGTKYMKKDGSIE